MQAENKHLKDQGLEKIYTQKDYEQLKEQHEKEIEVLKKELKKYKTQETYTPTKRMQPLVFKSNPPFFSI